MKGIFSFLWKALDVIQQIIMVITSVSIVVLILVQVALRYFFTMPLMGVEELACLCGFWLYFIGAANGARERSHIKADLLNVMIKNERALNVVKSLSTLCLVILSAIFVSWCFNYLRWSFKSWERSPALSIPMIYAQASLFASAVLMLFYFGIEMLDYSRQAMGYPAFKKE